MLNKKSKCSYWTVLHVLPPTPTPTPRLPHPHSLILWPWQERFLICGIKLLQSQFFVQTCRATCVEQFVVEFTKIHRRDLEKICFSMCRYIPCYSYLGRAPVPCSPRRWSRARYLFIQNVGARSKCCWCYLRLSANASEVSLCLNFSLVLLL